jgi:hypothetical protein
MQLLFIYGLCIKFLGVDWNPSCMILVPMIWTLVYVSR